MKRGTLAWLRSIHLYLGLVCAPYLVLYGVTTLSFNHDWEAGHTQRSWRAEVEPAVGATSDRALAKELREQLDLAGHVPPWRVRRDAGGALHFLVNRPGASYEVSLPRGSHTASVEETRSSWLDVMRGLHGGKQFPGTPWSLTWRVYTDLSLVTMSFALVSGALLWWPRKSTRRAGWIALALGTGGSLALMARIVC